MTIETARPLLDPFPEPGPMLQHAYLRLTIAATGSPAERQAVGDPEDLPRPWLPETCTDPRLRRDLWAWLEHVVIWINSQYTWDTTDMIPTCWPQHPHLIRELATVADQYRRSATAVDSTPLEEWHRYTLPMFTDRMRTRYRQHCDSGHKPSPGAGRQHRHQNSDVAAREHAYQHDVAAFDQHAAASPRLMLVDTSTGEIT